MFYLNVPNFLFNFEIKLLTHTQHLTISQNEPNIIQPHKETMSCTEYLQLLLGELNPANLDHLKSVESSLYKEIHDDQIVEVHYQSKTDLSNYARPGSQHDAERAKKYTVEQSSTQKSSQQFSENKLHLMNIARDNLMDVVYVRSPIAPTLR